MKILLILLLLSAARPVIPGERPAQDPEWTPGRGIEVPKKNGPLDCRAMITRAPGGLTVWSPNGTQYIVNKKDTSGTYQLYVGNQSGIDPVCITCTARPNSPLVNRHKLQPRWHPSGKWIVLAGERDSYDKPWLATPDVIEGWVQSGLFVNIYMTRPDGSEWYRLSNFGQDRGNGFTGVAFTPDGSTAVWAQIIDGNIFEALFGHWELILADFREDINGVPAFSNLRNITPAGAAWVETGNFAPDGKSLLITADAGLKDPQGMDQFILDITTGALRNLTNTPDVWDEHGVFSPDGKKILFMSSYPFRADPLSHLLIFLKTEFMLMSSDGSDLQQLTHFNSPGSPESNAPRQGSVAANGAWSPDGKSASVLNLFFPAYETWLITFRGICSGETRAQATSSDSPFEGDSSCSFATYAPPLLSSCWRPSVWDQPLRPRKHRPRKAFPC